MKICTNAKCRHVFSDDTLSFCLYDGAPLTQVDDQAQAAPPATHLPYQGASVAPSAPVPMQKAGGFRPQHAIAGLAGLAVVLALGIAVGSRMASRETTSPRPTPVAVGTPAPGSGVPSAPAEPEKPGLKSHDPATPVGGEQPVLKPDAPTDPIAAEEANLKSAIQLCDAAEISAFSNLDPSPLSQIYKGEALRQASARLDRFKSQGISYEQRLDGQQFVSFKISPDGQKAEVRLIETWSGTQYSISTRQSVQVPAETFPQTVFLEKDRDGWKIYAVVFDTPNSGS